MGVEKTKGGIDMSKSKVVKIYKTCSAFPAQWEGRFEDGGELFIRYRWGYLSVDKDDEEIFGKQIGNSLHGMLSYERLKSIVTNINFPQQEQEEH